MLARVREAPFNILGSRVLNARIADCFSGTGAIGLEALSRGASHVDFFESGRHALKPLERNIAMLGLLDRVRVHTSDLPKAIKAGRAWDLIIVDQPWTMSLGHPVVAHIVECDRLSEDGLLVLSERRGVELEDAPWNALALEVVDRRHYGDSSLVFLAKMARDR